MKNLPARFRSVGPCLFAVAVAVAVAAVQAPAPASAAVVRSSPDFAFAGGKSLRDFKGQPVVLLVAPSPRSHAFRKQVKRFEQEYRSFAARGVIFVAAFTESSEGLRSNIPFAVARDGVAVAARYEAPGPFALLVIGKDGNLDLRTSRVSPVSRAMDAILNNFALQSAERRG